MLEDARVWPKQAAVHVLLADQPAAQHHGVQRHGGVRLAHHKAVALLPRGAVTAGVHDLAKQHGHHLRHAERAAKVERAPRVAVPQLNHAAPHGQSVQLQAAAQLARALVLRRGRLLRAHAVQPQRPREPVRLHADAHDGLVGRQPREAPLYGRGVGQLDALLEHHDRVVRGTSQVAAVLRPRAAARVLHVRKRDLAAGAALHRVKQRLRPKVRLLEPRARRQVLPALLTHHGVAAHAAHAAHKEHGRALVQLQLHGHGRGRGQHLLGEHARDIAHAPVAQRRREGEALCVAGQRNTAVRHDGAAPLARLQQALGHQRADGLAHRAAAHAKARHQLGLGRDVAPPPPLVAADLLAHDAGQLHVKGIGRAGREERGALPRGRGRFRPPVRRGKAKVRVSHAHPQLPQPHGPAVYRLWTGQLVNRMTVRPRSASHYAILTRDQISITPP